MEKKIGTADFVTRLADKGYTKKDSAVILADVLDVIYEAIKNGESVNLIGFGSFKIKKINAKDIINVNTGERCTVPPHNIVKFVPGLALKQAAGDLEIED